MSVADTKPEPIRVGVEGIAPKPLVLTPERPRIDWAHLAALPPFQMFAAERMRNTSGKDSMEHALDYVRGMGAAPDVLQAYEAWHDKKGYWPNETPYGEVKQCP